MPSVSEKQRRFMAEAAHDSAFAKRAGIKQSVAKEFNQADHVEPGMKGDMMKDGCAKCGMDKVK